MNDLYRKLVDLYAGSELPEELMDELDRAAFRDPALAQDMLTLKKSVEALQAQPAPEFDEETHERILGNILSRMGETEHQRDVPSHLQFRLPMTG